MTKTYTVTLHREYRVEVGAIVNVEASSPAEALQKALDMSNRDEVDDLNYPEGEETSTRGQVADGRGGWVTGHS